MFNLLLLKRNSSNVLPLLVVVVLPCPKTSTKLLSSSSTTTTNDNNKPIERFKGYHRTQYKYWLDIQTRWDDADVYNHVNNVKYYAYFDTVINHFLIYHAGLVLGNHHHNKPIGFCVSSSCEFFVPIEYPQIVQAGIFISKISKSSVKYEIGIFTKQQQQLNVTTTLHDPCRAHGTFVHVFVDPITRKPVQALPHEMKIAMESILK
jgi:acyl-CoA thioester hydrolase